MINIIGSSRYKINRKHLKDFIATLYSKYSLDPAYILNLVFVGKRKMKSIALTYKNENEALPVLAFPYHESEKPEKLLGEIVICYPQAVLLSAERNKKVEDMLAQLIDHGLKNIIQQ